MQVNYNEIRRWSNLDRREGWRRLAIVLLLGGWTIVTVPSRRLGGFRRCLSGAQTVSKPVLEWGSTELVNGVVGHAWDMVSFCLAGCSDCQTVACIKRSHRKALK